MTSRLSTLGGIVFVGVLVLTAPAAAVDVTETVDETTDAANDTVDDTTEDTTESADDTTDDATESTDDATDRTTESPTDPVDETANPVTETTDEVTETTDEVTETTDEVTETTDEVTETTLVDRVSVDGDLRWTLDDVLVTAPLSTPPTVGGTAVVGVDAGVEPRLGPTSPDRDAGATTTTRVAADDGAASPEASSDDATSGEGTKTPSDGETGDPVVPLTAGAATLGLAGFLSGAGRQFLTLVGSSSTTVAAPASSTAGTTPAATADAAGWRERLWRILGLFGYQRYDDSDPLEHDARAAIHDLLQEQPGTYLSAIAEETDLPLPTVRYHLKVLEREHCVVGEKIRGKRRFFPAGTEPSTLAATLGDDGAAAVLETLARHGPDSVSGLAERVDRDVSTVTHHLQRLDDDGLVEREREGRAVVNRLAADVRDVLGAQGVDDGSGGSGTAAPAVNSD
jgi:DNA-binding transcriptional ArsR family regulator